MEANVYNTTGKVIGTLVFCNTYDLQCLFEEYICGSVKWFNDGFKMSIKTLKEVKAVIESKSFLRMNFGVTIKNMKEVVVLNPFSCKLGKKGTDRYYNLTDKKCVYQNGVYKVFEYSKDWFVSCRKNIVVTETTGIPKELIDALAAARCPKEQNERFRYLAIEETYYFGRKYAKEENFKIKNI